MLLISRITLSVFVLLLSTSAFASKTLKMNMAFNNVKQVYKKSDTVEGKIKFELKEHSGLMVVTGGIDDDYNREEVEINEVPGVNVEGHNFFHIIKIDNKKIKMILDQLTYTDAETNQTPLKLKLETTAYFSKGDWDTFIAGQDIEISISKKSAKKLNKLTRKLMKQILDESFEREFGNQGYKTKVKIKSFDFPNTPLTGNIYSLQQEYSGNLKIAVKIYGL